MTIRKSTYSSAICLLVNIAIVYLAYFICRFVYIFENWNVYSSSMTWSLLGSMLRGGWMFDTSAILYTNIPYILLMLLPLHFKESDRWQKAAKWEYIIVNGLCIAMNLTDAVYFTYTGKRTTSSVFTEFGNEGNLAGIFGIELLRHWYLTLIFIAMVWGMWKLYMKPVGPEPSCLRKPLQTKRVLGYYAIQLACLLAAVPLCVAGMRGGFTKAVRPITISNANQYVDSPRQAAAVLNTPFALIRTVDKKPFVVPDYMSDAEMQALYSPLHQPADTVPMKRKNVVVLIVESFGMEYIGAYNKELDAGRYRGYTPFVDSLINHSATWRYSFSNGRKSIDGMPSILSSIPKFVENFFLTPASMNNLSGLAGELGRAGYYSAFFHGAQNGSMGFEAFARATRFDDYFGRTEFNEDKRFRGDEDFDGVWAIWDEPFLQYYALKMSEFRQPFVTAVFTASSHHPYRIPEQYRDRFPEGPLVIHKCIRYTDWALRRFFETASRQPWYENTVFVLTADHTNLSDHEYYGTDLGAFSVPILIFDPSGDITPGMRRGIAQQIDIMPTVLGMLGYDRPYVAFGKDLFSTPDNQSWAVNYNGDIYQYIKGDWFLQFDGEKTKAVYDFRHDPMLRRNLAGQVPGQHELEKELKAIIRSYMQRMTTNSLVAGEQAAARSGGHQVP